MCREKCPVLYALEKDWRPTDRRGIDSPEFFLRKTPRHGIIRLVVDVASSYLLGGFFDCGGCAACNRCRRGLPSGLRGRRRRCCDCCCCCCCCCGIASCCLGEAGLGSGDVAPLLHHGLLDLPGVLPGPGADLLGDVHALLVGLEEGHQLGHVAARALGLQVASLLRDL